ncbi:MAG: GntR family transcriptional regulator, partial [Planctomycetota bacterium]|nr:GntR family transcriptional regulator [Planctomycetota bacterium]
MITKEPLHIKISNVLRREIRRKKPKERLESEQILANRFGVSSLTIREALAKLAEEGLIERKHGSGTFVKEKKSAVALLVAEWLFEARGSFFFMRLSQMLRENLMRSGCEVSLHLGKFEPWQSKGVNPRWPLVAEIEKGALAGVIAICVEPPLAWIEYALERGIACVAGGNGLPYSVGSDHGAMVREGVRFLHERGKKHIAFFQWE